MAAFQAVDPGSTPGTRNSTFPPPTTPSFALHHTPPSIIQIRFMLMRKVTSSLSGICALVNCLLVAASHRLTLPTLFFSFSHVAYLTAFLLVLHSCTPMVLLWHRSHCRPCRTEYWHS
ncbi:unnamed protein product [Hydatigera taeniaeformis]|uniref:CASP-like protein n=1 Tax=Hydatigena taeniaeformis TaxID=6205 RepID=A0A0R3X821_HYDTA|nr:unnamed protein product [Hydatigera taeniaeformis]